MLKKIKIKLKSATSQLIKFNACQFPLAKQREKESIIKELNDKVIFESSIMIIITRGQVEEEDQ